MIKILSNLMLWAALLTVLGCATTEDPRQGGLFGFNPAAYERRIAEREATLEALKREESTERQKTDQLTQDKIQKQDEKNAVTHSLAEMEKQINSIENKISATRIQTSAQQEEHDSIISRLDEVKRQLKDAESGDDAAKRKEVDRLNTEIDRLLQEADALSNM